MSYKVSRLTLYAVLSAIEEDLRNAVFYYLSGERDAKEILEPSIFDRAIGRLEKDTGVVEVKPTLDLLLPYIDFSDAYSTLNSNRAFLPDNFAKYIKSITGELEKLIPIRNRVAHSRPLYFDDFSVTLDTASGLLKNASFVWDDLSATLARLRAEPSFVLGLKIPSYYTDDNKTHNLPLPEFDETGFVGRDKQVKEVIKHCLGPYPVITIIGDGGVGKTALALKVAYDILDMPDTPFEAIVWTSSKTSQLTANEIVKIQGAISDSLGMFQNVIHTLAGNSVDDPIDEILEYLEQFKILLILDNLETVLDNRIRSFLSRLPLGSKIVITSRIGLGEYEFRIKLDPMSKSEAVQFLRALARMRGIEELARMPQERLQTYCNKMQNSPGYIKWFVSAVATGKRPEEVLDKPELFLDFCMSNVYEYLSENSRKVLNAMVCVPGERSQAELEFLSEITVLELQQSLQQLLTTNMVIMNSIPVGSSFTSQYSLADLPREYLLKHHPPTPEEHSIITRRRRQLVAAEEKARAQQKNKPYSPYSILIRSQGDFVVAKYLRSALDYMYSKMFDKAEEEIKTARDLAPEYFEVHRVDARIKVSRRNIPAARNAYEAAIDLESEHSPLLYWYGSFLLSYLDDAHEALHWFEKAAQLDKQGFHPHWGLARANLYLMNFDMAKASLDHILSVSKDLLSDTDHLKVYDLYLQIYIRQAENFIAHNVHRKALECLKLVEQKYKSYPARLTDNQMRYKLIKGVNLLRECLYFIGDEVEVEHIQQLIHWMENEGRKVYSLRDEDIIGLHLKGKIDIVQEYKPFGFINGENGTRFFFHKKDLQDGSEWRLLRKGTEVRFTASRNDKGLSAIKVKIDDE